MDIENFSRSDIKRHLAELGYSNITEEKLDGFVRYIYFILIWVFGLYICFLFFGCLWRLLHHYLHRDLRKLIKYEERKKEVENKLEDIDQQSFARRSKVGNLPA